MFLHILSHFLFFILLALYSLVFDVYLNIFCIFRKLRQIFTNFFKLSLFALFLRFLVITLRIFIVWKTKLFLLLCLFASYFSGFIIELFDRILLDWQYSFVDLVYATLKGWFKLVESWLIFRLLFLSFSHICLSCFTFIVLVSWLVQSLIAAAWVYITTTNKSRITLKLLVKSIMTLNWNKSKSLLFLVINHNCIRVEVLLVVLFVPLIKNCWLCEIILL